MPLYYIWVQERPDSEAELKEVSAPDFVRAVQALAAWRPGINILKLEGVWVDNPACA